MLTVSTYENEILSCQEAAQNEIPMTDAEVSQRVQRIRSGWSMHERVERRREAERRFAKLIESLSDVNSAA